MFGFVPLLRLDFGGRFLLFQPHEEIEQRRLCGQGKLATKRPGRCGSFLNSTFALKKKGNGLSHQQLPASLLMPVSRLSQCSLHNRSGCPNGPPVLFFWNIPIDSEHGWAEAILFKQVDTIQHILGLSWYNLHNTLDSQPNEWSTVATSPETAGLKQTNHV